MASTFNFLLMLISLVFYSSKVLAELTSEQKVIALDLHNQYRRPVYPPAANMLKITWADELADQAQEWADNCTIANNPQPYVSGFGRVGQNFYASSESENIVRRAIESWGAERELYHENGSCDTEYACGHYTQLVWAKSYKLGMGVSAQKCSSDNFPSGMYLVVAYYSQAGNYLGEFPYEKGIPASKCFAGSAPGDDGLCWVTDEAKLKDTIGE
ncbi:CAP domain-containing protein [Penicillium cataractarum]|uniref:CAP domain-containing protein n=1 Tax=Penicillium cataractarum TaxID=2100454 RepID=A0A9W9SNE7_9EURO|nr:CAP domain-containing protein [Penicillium cataractarum]KAJ5381706.1 CAP domain-containing protein [Penicillium cataractarum]